MANRVTITGYFRRLFGAVIAATILLSLIALTKFHRGYHSHLKDSHNIFNTNLLYAPSDGITVVRAIIGLGCLMCSRKDEKNVQENFMADEAGFLLDGALDSNEHMRQVCRFSPNKYQELIVNCGGSVKNPPPLYEISPRRSVYFFHSGRMCLGIGSVKNAWSVFPSIACFKMPLKAGTVHDDISNISYSFSFL